MDFFEAQERARRTTWKLMLLYAAAVILIIVSIYLLSVFLLGFAGHAPPGTSTVEQLWHPGLLLTVSTFVIMIILAGSLFRIAQLRKGGTAVAEMLGGRKVEPSTRHPLEQRLMNVVEEMAIASGLPVPDVFLLDREESINAFAAGFGTNDAAVGVTRGALEQLDRDELQGVIAHEFSHIFNGDMRLNIRLIGILNGILLLHITGLILMRSAAWSGAVRGGGGRGQGGAGQAAIVILLLGMTLIVIGYIGMVFGRLIQAAVSRQREYLADAAAVQYTRNPRGLAGALGKIAGKKHGGGISDGHAMEMSHLFFVSSFHSSLDRLLATHPPIEKRIRAIDPSHEAEEAKLKARVKRRMEKERIGAARPAQMPGGGHPALTPEVILAAIGTLPGDKLDRARQLLANIPASLKSAAHEPLEAEALVYALLLTAPGAPAGERADRLGEIVGPEMEMPVRELLDRLSEARREWYLPLTELALPALRTMSRTQYRTFRATVERLVREPETTGLFALALEKLVVRNLDTAFSESKRPKTGRLDQETLRKEALLLLSAVAHASGGNPEHAWRAAVEPLGDLLPHPGELLPEEQCGVAEIGRALDALALAAADVRKFLLAGAIHAILADNRLTLNEQELLRAISEALDCPMPLDLFETGKHS